MTRARLALPLLFALGLFACNRTPSLPEAPTIGLSADALAFALPADGASFPTPQSVLVRNVGSGTLAIPLPSITLAAYQAPAGAPSGWLYAELVAEGDGYRLRVQPTVQSGDCWLPPGDYVATVTLTSPGAVNSPRNVRVTLRVPPPALAPLPANLSFTAPLDGSDPGEQALELRGIGGYGPPAVEVLGFASWLTVRTEPVPGTFRSRLVVGISGAGDPGHSEMSLAVRLPGEVTPAAVIAVLLDVPAPHLRVEPSEVRLTVVADGLPTQQVVTVHNDGRRALGTLGVEPQLPRPSWLGSGVTVATPPWQVAVAVDPRGLAPGTYQGGLVLRLGSADNSPFPLPVTLEVVRPPPVFSPSFVTFEATARGDPPPQTVQVLAPDAAPMPAPTVTISYDSGDPASSWLTASLAGAAAPYTLELRASAAGLPIGSYSARVQLTNGQYAAGVLGVTFHVGRWTLTGPMKLSRLGHTATALLDGRVLVVGGATWLDATHTATTERCEVYDPAADVWTEVGPLSGPRGDHAAALLGDGRVLVTGGYGDVGALGSLELFDPATGTFAPPVALPAMGRPTATVLADGTVLLAGLGHASLFDPGQGAAVPTGSPGAVRERAGAVRLHSGRVLVAGGVEFGLGASASAELYDPGTGSWGATGSLAHRRADHALVLLPDGRALAVGGYDGTFLLKSAEIYDEATGTWSPAADASFFRTGHGVLLPGGKVLVGPSGIQTELYDPATDSWSSGGLSRVSRSGPTVTLLPDGRPLIVGGEFSAQTSSPYAAEVHGAYP